MKTFKGKAIYNPSGKAREYAKWACNFYVGCSNGCEYCYCKKGVLAGTMGGDKPTLKKCFRDENHALEIFAKELVQNLHELQKHGLFFSFTTDPMLPETFGLHIDAAGIAVFFHGVPVKILTKYAGWVDDYLRWMDYSNSDNAAKGWRKNFAFGFTLTGHDELEPGASTNAERVQAMKKLHDAGFRTWASIEPIVDFDSSYQMIEETVGFCDLYKIGLMSGKKYHMREAQWFFTKVNTLAFSDDLKIYWKESFKKMAMVGAGGKGIVDRDYNIFQEDQK